MHSNRSRPLLAVLVVLSGIVWALAWGFNGQTDEGNLRVLGLTEGAWRAVMNPVLGLVLVAAMAWAASRPRSAEALLVVAGLGAMLAGNLLEFGLLGRQTPMGDIGWVLFLVGALAATSGLGVGVGGAAARSSRRPALGVAAGAATVAGVVVMSVAVPAAASMALFPLVDALLRGDDQAEGGPSRAAAAMTASAVAQG